MATTTTPTVILITGPNQGIGHGLLSALLTRPNHIIIGAVRDPNSEASLNLNTLPKASSTTLHIVKIDSAISSDPGAALQTLQAAGVTHIDTIVANAAAADTTESALDTPTDEVIRHLKINVIGILALFQAFEPLLRNAQARNPKFIAVTSELGSIGMAPNMPGPWFCYGVTKAALNYMVRRVHVENDWLTAVALQPGWTQTEAGERAAGMESAPMRLEESVAGCLKVIDSASREKYAGKVVSSGLETSAW